MNRNEAKIWTKLSREELREIGKIGYEKHYDFICEFGSGAEIESKHIEGTKWVEDNYPDFFDYMEYRVKPAKEAQAAGAYKPNDGEHYYYVSDHGAVIHTVCSSEEQIHKARFSFRNSFKMQEEAFAALDRVRAALKGETVSKTETVENKSHVVELSEKLGEPSIAVFHCDGKCVDCGAILRGRGAAVELDGDKERVLTGLGFLFASLFRRGFKAGTLEKVLEISTKHFYERGKKIKVEKIEV